MSKRYFISVPLMAFVIPAIGFLAEHFSAKNILLFDLFAKWFIFSAVGLRLFVAGLQQTIKPAFTASDIFHMQHTESYPVVRELGFATSASDLWESFYFSDLSGEQ